MNSTVTLVYIRLFHRDTFHTASPEARGQRGGCPLPWSYEGRRGQQVPSRNFLLVVYCNNKCNEKEMNIDIFIFDHKAMGAFSDLVSFSTRIEFPGLLVGKVTVISCSAKLLY